MCCASTLAEVWIDMCWLIVKDLILYQLSFSATLYHINLVK